MDRNEDDIIHVCGRDFHISEEIKFEDPFTINEKYNINEKYKDALLANLYSTNEFLKSELIEKNNIIKTLLSQIILKDTDEKSKHDMETSSIPVSKDSNFINSHISLESSIINDNDIPFNCDNTSIITKDEYIARDLNSTTNEVINDNLDNAIETFRRKKHEEYNQLKGIRSIVARKVQLEKNSSTHKWPKNTLLIISDSIMNQLDEKRLSNRGLDVKVRAFSGSTVNDMHDYVKPLLKKEPDYILIHIGSNDAPFKSAEIIFDDILLLRNYIQETLPNVKIIISEPIMRTDNLKANAVINQLVRKLEHSDVSLLVNCNINESHLGRKGLHLNARGNGRLALNIMLLISQL